MYIMLYTYFTSVYTTMHHGVFLFMPLQQISTGCLSSGDQWADLTLPECSKSLEFIPEQLHCASMSHISHPKGLTCSPCDAKSLNHSASTPEMMVMIMTIIQ